MSSQRVNSSVPGVEQRLRRAHRRGFADGVASVLGGSVTGPGRPVRVRLDGWNGSLEDDWDALRCDGERLFDGR